jgi:hypothetical protein
MEKEYYKCGLDIMLRREKPIGGAFIARYRSDEEVEFAVRACNNHRRLVDALKDCIEDLDYYSERDGVDAGILKSTVHAQALLDEVAKC